LRIQVDDMILRHPVLPLGRSELRNVLGRILERLELSGTNLELLITSDQAMAVLHAKHLNGVGPTNVLAFPNTTSAEKTRTCLGAIALNADAVIREAWLYRQNPIDQFIRLVTHALLHLTGFEHGQLMDELTESVVEEFQNGFSSPN